MVSTDDLIAIVGGSLAGLVVLLIFLAVIIYCTCGKSRKREKQSQFKHLSPSSNETSVSKQSNFSDGIDPRLVDPRLPKVSSNGLWMGAPSMYSNGPSPAYYADKPRRNPSVQRATSEDRMGQPHMVYQGNMHIYHSQPTHPMYEHYGGMVRSNSYRDLYGPYAGYPSGNQGRGIREMPLLPPLRRHYSTAVLVEYPGESEYFYESYRDSQNEHRKTGKKVQRTHSDLTGTKRKRRQRRQESPHDIITPSQGNREGQRDNTAFVEVHSRRTTDKSANSSHKTESASSTQIQNRELSQTDSAKLRAMQERSKEPDVVPVSSKWTSEDLRLNLPRDSDDERNDDINVNRYQYQGNMVSSQQKDKRFEIRENQRNKQISGSTFVSVNVQPDNFNKSSYTNTAYDNSDDEDVRMRESGKKKVERVESNADGKKITEAFDFLNTYLSDDEGTDFMESRAHSPQPLS